MAMSERRFAWPEGQQCAVSLSYDDGLPVHYELVGPLLDQAGMRATFYVPAMSDIRQHPERWRALARRGHELGNHSLFHPCYRTPEREDWLAPHLDLGDYTVDRLRHELEIANLMLHLVDGQVERSYGNTCCETTVGRGSARVSMDSVLRDLFVAARGPGNGRIADVREPVNLMQVGHYGGDEQAFETMRTEIERAIDVGGWIIWMIHGVGEGTHGLYIDTSEHEKLIAWLRENRDRIWTAPVVKVAQHVKHYQR
jgi:peptidoglycan/xylan/chitin deacetylase (PgdA/CDA1 family)